MKVLRECESYFYVVELLEWHDGINDGCGFWYSTRVYSKLHDEWLIRWSNTWSSKQIALDAFEILKSKLL